MIEMGLTCLLRQPVAKRQGTPTPTLRAWRSFDAAQDGLGGRKLRIRKINYLAQRRKGRHGIETMNSKLEIRNPNFK